MRDSLGMSIIKHQHPTRRIARHLIFWLILASALITMIITGVQLYRDYSYDIDQIDKRFNQIEHVYLQPLSHALWATDSKEMQLQIDGMIHLPDMQYIAIYEDNKLLVSAGEIKKKNILSTRFPLLYEHRGIMIKIGELEVVATLEGVYQRLYNKIWNILISNAIKTFIIAFFFIYIFQRLVTRHINHLADQVRMVDADRLEKPITLERTSHQNANGDEFDVLINAFDVMRKRILENFEKLKRREQDLKIYEKILETTDNQMSYVDRNYIYHAVNDAYTKMYGKSRKEIIGHSVSDLIGEKLFLESAKPNLDKVFQGEHLQRIVSLVNKDGKLIHMEINYYPYYGDSTEVQGAVINARDVTDHLHAEEERMRNAQVYAALAQQGAIQFKDFLRTSLTLLKDVFQSKYAFVGRLVEQTFIIQTECVLVGNQVIENFTYELTGTPCEKVFDNDKVFFYDDVIKRFPEDNILVDMNAQTYYGVSLVDTQGRTLGVLAILDTEPHAQEPWHSDTLEVFAARIAVEMERANALYKLESYNEELEKQVATRTYELENSLKELETFSYSVSHDLRAPLRAINGFSQILIEEYALTLGEGGVNHLAKIKYNTERMSNLIDNLLRLSRVTRHNMELEYVNLSKLCESIVKQNIDQERIVNLNLSIQPGIIAHCDAKLIRIALENLLDNAIKYSSLESSPRISIGAIHHEGEEVFCINDNGVGFESKFADKIFQPFQRLHDGEFNGTGIGLATVQRVIVRHGGKIWAESMPKQGARFYFALPGNFVIESKVRYSNP